MESTKRAIRFQTNELIKSITGFWGTMFIVNIFLYIINYMNIINVTTGLSKEIGGNRVLSIAGVNLIPILIYFVAYSYEMYYEDFPILISFSVTRRDYYKSIIVTNVETAFIFATILGILLKIDPIFIRAIGRIPLEDYLMFNTLTDSIVFIILSLFISFLSIASITNFVSVLNYKFGYKMWIFYGVLMSFILTNKIRISVWDVLVRLLNTRMDLNQLLKLGLTVIVFYFLGYIIIKNTNIRNKVS